MKKLKLFIAALAFIGGGNYVAAQTWTPSAPADGGNYYLYNVGAKGYMVAGNNWGTRASINPQGGILTTFAAANGAYEIKTSPSFSNKHLGFNGYVDNGDANQNWTVESVEGEADVYRLKTASGTYLFADQGATTTSVGPDPGTDYCKWMLVTRADRIADLEANASKDNPLDATFLLVNPNFDRECNTSMWTGGVSLGGNNENYCAEKFNTTFDVYQTVTDAPKGAYALAFQGFYRYGGHGINPAGDARKNGTEQLNTKLYANDTEAPLMSILDETTAGGGSVYDGVAYPNSMNEASTAFSKGLYSTSMDFTVDVNTIKVGVKKSVAVENDWTIFDNARLTYYGPVVDFTIYITNLKTAVDNAEALYEKLPSKAKENLKKVVDDNNKEYSDVDGYIEAISNIKEATEKATAISEAYLKCKALLDEVAPLAGGYSKIQDGVTQMQTLLEAAEDVETLNNYVTSLTQSANTLKEWVAIKKAALALLPVANDNETANDQLQDTYDEQEAIVQDAELIGLSAKVADAVAKLKDACKDYVFSVSPVGEDAKFDCTFLITNPDLTGLAIWERCDGWTTENSDGNYNVMVNDSKTVTIGGKTYDYFYEYWSNPAKANGKFALYNAVTLPAGTFEMSCLAFAEDQYTSTKNSQVFFYANDTQGSKVDAAVLTAQTLEFNNAAEGEVKIGLKTLAGNTYNWMGIGYVELYKVPAATTAYAITVDAANATVKVMQGETEVSESLPLETITLNVTPDEGYEVAEVTAVAGGETVDVANPSEGVYTFQMPKADVEVTVTTKLDMLQLTNQLAYAEEINVKVLANSGDAAFQAPTAAAEALAAAIAAAKSLLTDDEATPDDVKQAVSDLEAAVEIELNAPAEGQLFNVILTYEGWAYDNMAMTYIANGRSDQGNYNIQYAAEANENLAQAFTFTKNNAGNVYTMSQIDADGNVRYLSTGACYGGNDSQIRTTTNADDALEVFVCLTDKEGVWNLLNTKVGDTFIGSQDAGVYTVNSHIDFKLVETAKPEVSINTADAGWGTVVLPFKADIPEGVTVYSCAAADGATLTLEEVEAVEANKPYIVEGAWTEELTGDAQGTQLVNTEGWLTGVYADQAAEAGSYVLQKQADKVGFFKVADAESRPVVGANHAYLTVPAAAAAARPAFILGDGTTTAISAIEALTSGNARIFNANGAQLPRLQKGVNIVRQADGKSFKVVVK